MSDNIMRNQIFRNTYLKNHSQSQGGFVDETLPVAVACSAIQRGFDLLDKSRSCPSQIPRWGEKGGLPKLTHQGCSIV